VGEFNVGKRSKVLEMKARLIVLLLVTHVGVGLLGFGLGIYALPILTAPASPTKAELEQVASSPVYQAEFVRELKGSDTFHWGEGTVSISAQAISFEGELAPGPDYKLYLSPAFVETEAEFEALKGQMLRIGDIKTFQNFIVPLDSQVNPSDYTSVIVWCESFGEFITAAKYR
jgi:hypothetical protein